MKNQIASWFSAVVLSLYFATVLCAWATPPRQEPDARIVEANNRFGFKLFSELRKKESNKNIFISPASVAMALQMTYNGAAGETQQAMVKALELNELSLDDINAANLALRASLTNPDPKVQLSIGNSLWARKGFPFKPEFMKRNANFFGAELSELDFNSPQASATINDWVSANTKGKIKKIVPDPIDPDMVLYLINAIYFKGEWTEKFDKRNTADAPFYLLGGKQKQVPLMYQGKQFPFFAERDFQAVSLPFGGGRLSMYVFLPSEQSSLDAFCRQLTATNWEKWMAQFRKAEVDLWLPRFKSEYEATLNDALKALGMAVAFDEGRADFSRMRPTPPNLFISEVKHKTFVEVNEEGAEAAAATSVGMMLTSIPMRHTMRVDRPFFCAIRDNQSGAVLFMGAIVEPK